LPATRCGLFRRRSLGIAISRLHIVNDLLAALTYENMLDPHVLLRAAPEAPLDLNLHRESRQQASRSRSKRCDAPIAATPTA
jgi:hypothetical protein